MIWLSIVPIQMTPFTPLPNMRCSRSLMPAVSSKGYGDTSAQRLRQRKAAKTRVAMCSARVVSGTVCERHGGNGGRLEQSYLQNHAAGPATAESKVSE